MNKKGNWRRIVAGLLSLAMIIGGLQYAGDVSKAATTYSGSLTLTGSQVEEHELVDIMAKNTQVYLCGDSGLASVPADSNWQTRYKAATDDSESGIFVDGVKQEGGLILKYDDGSNWWFAEGFAPAAGQTLTIKGAFVNGDTTVNITEVSFVWDGTRFAPAKEAADMELVDIEARGDGNANGFYIITKQKGTSIDDGMAYNGDWSLIVHPKQAAYSGVLVDGKYYPIFLKKLTSSVYYVCLADKEITATADTTITIRGQFYYEDYVVDFNETTYKFDGTSTWTSTKVLQSGALNLVNCEVAKDNNNNMAQFYAAGDEVLDSAIKAPADGDWADRLYGCTAADGVFYNGTKIENHYILKYNNTKNWWYVRTRLESAVAGDIVTVKGDFALANGTRMINIKETSFKWTGSIWAQVFEKGTITVDGAQITTTNPAQLYLKGDTVLDTYKIGSNNDWSNRLYGITEEDGIFFNGTRISTANLVKYNDAENWWFAEGFTATTAGDILTIKGDFGPSNKSNVVTITEAKFEWDGEKWINYVDDAVVYTSFTVDEMHKNTSIQGDGTVWHFYLKTDAELPGTAWGNVDGVAEYFAMTATVNGTETTLNAKKWDAKGLFIEIPTAQLPANTDGTLVVKAGKYKSNVQDVGYELTNDFTIYISEIGISLQQNLKSAMSTKPTFSLSSDNSSANGFYLKINTDDGAAYSGDWSKKLYPVLEGMTSDNRGKILSGGEYGLWKGDTYTGVSVPLVKLSSTSYYVALSDVQYAATEGDTYTFGGMFYDANHRVIEYEPITVTWDGSKWSTPAEWTSFTLTGIDKNTAYMTSTWNAYLYTSEELPGEAWGNVNGTPEAYQVGITVNGTATTVTAKKYDAKGLFLEIPTSVLGEAAEATLVVKAGRYRSNVQNVGLNITSDFTIYTNEYGWSTKGALALAMTSKPQFSLEAGAAEGSATGFVININMSDGTPEAVEWSTRLFPILHSVSDDKQTLYYTTIAENGLWKNGVHITTKPDGTAINSANKPLVKLSDTRYYVAIGDWGYTAEDGDRFTLGGVFYDSTGRLVEYQPITVEYNASTGKWQGVYTPLKDSGVVNDINADGEVNSCDLVRFLRWKNNGMTSINDTRADVNLSGTTNAKDVVSMRKILVGKLFYEGTDRVPYGVPYYTKGEKIEKLAYASPTVGTYDSTTQTYTRRSDEAAIDADFEDFKAAGLTLLNSENRAVLSVEAWDHVSNDGIKEYLVEAQEHGLGVIVYCEYLQFLLEGGIDMTEASQNPAYDYRWQEVMAHYVSNLSAYPAFKGFMMSDELTIAYIDNYRAVASFLRANYPGLMLHSSQLPVSVYQQSDGASNLTLDTSTNNTKEKAYRDYVYNFGMAAGHYTYDLYPLIVKTAAIIGTKTYSVNSEWFDNFKWVAEERKENGYAFTSGITIQSCALPQDASNWWQSSSERYAPTTREDMGFQIYTALAYGMEEINFFTYEDHWQANVTDAMADNASVYNAVKTVNSEIDAYGHVFKAFAWKETLDISAGSSASTALSPRLASASVTGARTLVGCMQDEEGFDGYMIANAAGPRTSTSATVTLTFNNAEKAIVYKNGVKSVVTLTNDAYTVSVGVGEGVFVIPYREKKN